MMVRSIMLLICIVFSQGFAGSKDLWVKKCEQWKDAAKAQATLSYELIDDQSILAKSSIQKKFSKIRLSNGLQVLLISDLSLEESAASLSVRAGTWDDPEEYLGMAHFVEHLLFLGTEAYPKESEYSQYILERGGRYNAFTKHDRTSYGFSIPSAFFTGALDRLSHFFIDPLFTESSIQREIYAVHHEFEDAIENDALRVWRIFKESGNPHHPNVQLSCGNLESLSRIKRRDIEQWFHEHYHPERMRLVLMAPESLETLAEMADRFFSAISVENRVESKDKIQFSEEMTSLEQKGHIIHVRPAFKNRSLFLFWEIPSYLLTAEGHKAIHLLQMAIDHVGGNSLSKTLEKEGLAKEVHADFWKMGQDHAFFMLNVLLTDLGIAQYEEVVLRCFQAFRRIEQLQIPVYLLKKLQYMEDAQLQAVFDDSFDYVMRISSELIDEEMKTYPDQTYTSSEEALSMTKSLLLELTPFRCLYFLVANPEEVGIRLSRIEKWMGSEYAIRKIAEQKLQEWHQAKPNPSIGFQPEEELPTRKRDRIPIETEVEDREIPDPIFLIDDATARIRWVAPVVEGESIDAFFCITTPLMNSSAKHVAFNDIFVQGINDELKKEFSDELKVIWNVEMEGMDLCLFFSAPYFDYPIYFQRFFSALKQAHVFQEQFEKIKQQKLDSYPGDPSPMDYAHQILDSLLRPSYYTRMELYHALLQMEFAEYEVFQKTYFQEIFLEGAFLGGTCEQQIVQLWEQISAILDVKSSNFAKDRSKMFIFPEDAQSYLIMQKTHRRGNALLLLIEAGKLEEDLEVIHKILTTVLHSEFFEELRTRQQTAYKLHTWQELMNQKICHCFGVQSSTHAPLDLLYRVEKFLHEFALNGEEILTRDRFEVIRESLIMNAQNQKNSANTSEDLAWLVQNLERLHSLRYEQVIQEIANIFSSENRKRIAVLIEGSHQVPYLSQDGGNIQYIPIEKEYFYR